MDAMDKEIFVFDANVPRIFWETDYQNDLLDFFDDTQYKILMAQANFDEIYSYKIRSKLKNLKTFEIISKIDKKLIKSIKKRCGELYKFIHTKKDNDYIVMALAIKHNANYLVTNDRDIINAMKKYKKDKGYSKEELIITSIAALLKYMFELRKDMFTTKKHVKMNFNIYKKVEIPNFVDGIKNRQWDEYMVKGVFRPYATNVIKLFDNGGDIHAKIFKN
ncbi:hypothetical protein GF327_06610 [Candidatus Woesearchaeota archaeon]|nr:hypothetical protein [Candidatus Woesearchaeota archaeon]